MLKSIANGVVASATSKSSSSASSASSTASSASSTVLSQQPPPQPAAQLHSKQQHQLYQQQQQQQQKQLHNNSGASSSTNSSTNNSLNGTSLYYNTPGQGNGNGNGNGNSNTSNYHLFALSSQHNQPYDTSTIGTALGNFISNGGGGDQNPYNGNMNSLTKQFGHTMNLNGSATTTHNNMMMMTMPLMINVSMRCAAVMPKIFPNNI